MLPRDPACAERRRFDGGFMGKFLLFLFGLVGAVSGLGAHAEPSVTCRIGDKTEIYAAGQLLPHAVEVEVPHDPSYGRTMRYRAVPLWDLIGPQGMKAADTLEVKSLDGFVAQIPGALVLNRDNAKPIPMLAVEDPDRHWPNLPDGEHGAGPFRLIWIGPGVKDIVVDQWPYEIGSMAEQPPPEQRWPQLAVDARLPPNDPVRRGLQKFVATCGACHTLAGGGAATLGPDLNRPMSPTEYFGAAMLKKYIRNPAALRDWADRKMPAFPPDALSDGDIDLIIQYLAYKARTRR